MLSLGIETSCDETALALLEEGRVLGEVIFSQVDKHSIFGGVVPEMASREHLRKLQPLWQRLLQQTGRRAEELDLIAVARGPGLLGCLLVGLGFAKGLSLGLKIPLVGVNHLQAHLLAPGLEQELKFPAVGLLVSGGHTNLYKIDSSIHFRLLGRTLDDAVGEAFDKTARALNLPYPGGVYIDRFAGFAEPDQDMFPRPYLDTPSLDFSFSGLKTALINHIRKHPRLVQENPLEITPESIPDPELAGVCASFNLAAAETLQAKLERAVISSGVQNVIMAGGVAANSMIREKIQGLCRRMGLNLVLPSLKLCTDNASMIACCGEILARHGMYHNLELEAVPRGRKIPWDYVRDKS
ncbi:tRNA (adenosine(37)-N6)-threonylcarbamoyltransferase complex transferase subunit TsaD [Desulfonatronospira sp.]|uniref:tRNA (adenosine(37)-N6)-threonylcarbamoyltransferase complex transferase subunit TsaD n=1 Tax=Desulfonatronospira sp. TaxID=1962951 RepID=UPI0025BF4563|nr:tRNA (adenosine(37)-N6)-threonylcarbamoyltransferase complex transferase subunit TsaD [Desulfonatronospira sp.]